MATRNSFYPAAIADQILWHTAQRKLPGHLAALGLTAAQAAPVLADNERILYVLQTWRPAVARLDGSATAFVTALLDGDAANGAHQLPALALPAAPAEPPAVPDGALRRVLRFVADTKRDTVRCTPAIQSDLQWAGTPTPAPDPETTRPALRVRLTSSGKAEIIWVRDVFDGVFLDADRGDGKGYVFLDYDPRPNFTDNWLPPKGTTVSVRYRAQYSYKGERFGQFGVSEAFPLSGPE